MKLIACILSACCLISFACFGTDQACHLKDSLGQVPRAELPAAAAKAIQGAKPRERASTTIDVVKAALDLSPAAAPAIVGTMARSLPEVAAAAAGCAAASQPAQACAIARAAAATAPSKAGEIATAVCRAVPNNYREIALAIAKAVPGSEREVLRGVASAIPNLQSEIEKILAGFSGNNIPSVSAVLDGAAAAKNGAAAPNPIARGPGVGPPYIPYSGTARTVTPDTSGEVQPGGRDYARP